jgi:hypothetical protein
VLVSILLAGSIAGWAYANKMNRSLSAANDDLEESLAREKSSSEVVKNNLQASHQMVGDFSKIISEHVSDRAGQQKVGQDLVDSISRYSKEIQQGERPFRIGNNCGLKQQRYFDNKTDQLWFCCIAVNRSCRVPSNGAL